MRADYVVALALRWLARYVVFNRFVSAVHNIIVELVRVFSRFALYIIPISKAPDHRIILALGKREHVSHQIDRENKVNNVFIISLTRRLKEERNKVRHVDRLALDLQFRGLKVMA